MKSRCEEVSKQYEQDRRTVILPLGNVCVAAFSCILVNEIDMMIFMKKSIFLLPVYNVVVLIRKLYCKIGKGRIAGTNA